jgi:hypothetical protein
MNMNDLAQLKQMSESSKFVDMTDNIRDAKHSASLRTAIHHMMVFKAAHAELLKTDKVLFEERLMRENNFLFMNYMELYNLLLKNDMNMSIMNQLLACLESIEVGECDQTEASVRVGTLLKTIYIDSIIKDTPEKVVAPNKDITWAQYKTIKINP